MSDLTRRLRLPYPEGGDGPVGADVPYWMQRLATALDDTVLGYSQGTLAGRPAAAVVGRMYYATDDGCLYYDAGGTWFPAAWQPGDVRWTASRGTPMPAGWRVCDGTELSTASYPALFAAIGATYGGNSVSFTLPDLRGRTAIGTGTGTRLSARALGDRLGEELHQLSTAEIPYHAHTFVNNSRVIMAEEWSPVGLVIDHSSNVVGWVPTSITGIAHNQTERTGGEAAHNTMQPSLALNAWIKT